MLETPSPAPRSHTFQPRTVVLIAATLAIAALAAVITVDRGVNLSRGAFELRTSHLIAIEVAIASILVIELAGHDIQRYFEVRDRLQTGVAIRAVVRAAAYLALAVAVVSTLASNPALAVGVGSVTGLVIGFSAQNILGNALAGMILALDRPFGVGDEVTVMGQTGRVVELRLMHTVLDSGDAWVLIPSAAIMTSVVLRRKPGAGSKAGGPGDRGV